MKLLILAVVVLVNFFVVVRGDCMVMYQQCAKPVNGGPLKMFWHKGCRPQTGPNPDYLWVDAPLCECGGSDVE